MSKKKFLRFVFGTSGFYNNNPFLCVTNANVVLLQKAVFGTDLLVGERHWWESSLHSPDCCRPSPAQCN